MPCCNETGRDHFKIWELVSSRRDGANSQIKRVQAQPAAPRVVEKKDRGDMPVCDRIIDAGA